MSLDHEKPQNSPGNEQLQPEQGETSFDFMDPQSVNSPSIHDNRPSATPLQDETVTNAASPGLEGVRTLEPSRVPQVTSSPNTPENHKRRNMFLAGGAVLVLAAGGLVAKVISGGNESEKVKFQPGASAPSVITTTPTPTSNAETSPATLPPLLPTATPNPTAPEIKKTTDTSVIEAYRSLDIKQFNELPRETRLMVVYDTYTKLADGYLTQYMDQIMKDGQPLFDHNPAMSDYVPQITDDGQKILNYHLFGTSAAAALKVDITAPGEGPLDFNKAQQLLSGVTYNVGDKDLSNNYKGNVSVLDGIRTRTTSKGTGNAARLAYQQDMFVTETSDHEQGKDSDGNDITYKDIVYNTGHGQTFQARFIMTSFTDKSGAERHMWLIYQDKLVGGNVPSKS